MTEVEKATKTAEINKSAGLHVRPARELSDRANKFDCTISIREDSSPEADAVDAKSIMQLLTLGAGKGTKLVISAEGEDAEKAVEEISELIEEAGSSNGNE